MADFISFSMLSLAYFNLAELCGATVDSRLNRPWFLAIIVISFYIWTNA